MKIYLEADFNINIMIMIMININIMILSTAIILSKVHGFQL